MEQVGEYRITATREEVWAALNDAEILGRCIAGCQEVNKVDDQHFDVKVKAKVGPVSAVFQAALELMDLQPPESYVIQGNVKGGAAGFAKGSASVALCEDGAATVLSYQVNANVGGKLAQVGSRLVDGAARKMADDFFAAFSQQLSPETESNSTPGVAEKNSEKDSSGKDSLSNGYEGSGQGKIWLVAFFVLGLALVLTL